MFSAYRRRKPSRQTEDREPLGTALHWPENQREAFGEGSAFTRRAAGRRQLPSPELGGVGAAPLRNLRRHRHDDHDNQDRWMVSYADFITLLFAFFVVMYAMARESGGDFHALSSSIATAFTGAGVAEKAGPPDAVGAADKPAEGDKPGEAETPVSDEKLQAELQARRRSAMRNMAGELQTVLSSLVREGKVRVIENNRGITVEINESVLFASGQARLEGASVRALERVASVLSGTTLPIQVEGHTDNTPISTAQFPSNWELSAARAASVVRLFVESGVDAGRLSAIGYSDQRPLAANDGVDHKARNRRVNIMIEAPNLGSVSELSIPKKPNPAQERE